MKNRFPTIVATVVFAMLSGIVSAQSHSGNSVLAEGNWFKIGVVESGVYKLTYNDFVAMGADVNSINPQFVSFYGTEAGMLPQKNDEPRRDDLGEMAVAFRGNDNGSFEEDEFFLFYAEGPVRKVYNNTFQMLVCEQNVYSDSVFCFVRTDNPTASKRIADGDSFNLSSLSVIDSYLAVEHHERDINNPYSLGTRWYGETLSQGTETEFTKSFVCTDLMPGSKAKCYVSVIGRSLTESVIADISINGAEQGSIAIPRVLPSSNRFANEQSNIYEFDATETVNFKASLRNSSTDAMVGIDFVTLNVWKKLRFDNQQFEFSVLQNQSADSVVKVSVASDVNNPNIWKITSPLDVENVPFVAGDSLSFGCRMNSRNDFVVFNDSQAKQVVLARHIPNQNVHQQPVSTDMLIITHRRFADRADELAQLHLALDNLNCSVVDVDEIYNEFSGGRLDVSAIRDFIKMVYDRGQQRLKYVLLFGDASFDYRNISGQGGNFVPSLQSDNTYNFMRSYVTDDYFGLMDDGEGMDCAGVVDLGIGRLPVNTIQQAENVVDKIKDYVLIPSCYGEWKNSFLFVADDDKAGYIDACEKIEDVLKQKCPSFNVSKIYTDAYVRQDVAGGGHAYPEARADLLGSINKGVSVLAYYGHGGVRGWTEEGILTYNDILSMNNAHRLPFVFTATCEFSKFDNPGFSSAGEEMFLNRDGGAIAMFTSTRPTATFTNTNLGLHLFNALDSLNTSRLTFGGLTKAAKVDGLFDNCSFVLFGDPALRFSYPQNRIQVTSINGQPAGVFQTVESASMMNVEGRVIDADSAFVQSFNGVIDIKLYDKKVSMSTLSNNGSVETRDFVEYKNVVFEGRSKVENGTFSVSVPVSDVLNFMDGNARLSFYASDTINGVEATGMFDNFTLAVGSNAHRDNTAPAVDFYCNSTLFADGDVVLPNGIIAADIFDEQGICLYNNVIGRDMLLTHEFEGSVEKIVANGYCHQTEVGDFTRFRLEMPFTGLPSGEHRYTLRVSDNHGNTTEKEISFVVDFGQTKVNAVCYPNPSSTSTTFVVSCATESPFVDVEISIYSVIGQPIAELNRRFGCSGEASFVVDVDFRRDCGFVPENGVYVARIVVVDDKGKRHSTHQQMIIMN